MKIRKGALLDAQLKESWAALKDANLKFGPEKNFDELLYKYPWLWALWNEAYFKGRV